MSRVAFEMEPMSIARIIDRSFKLAPGMFHKMILLLGIVAAMTVFLGEANAWFDKFGVGVFSLCVFVGIGCTYLVLSLSFGIICLLVANDAWLRDDLKSCRSIMNMVSGKLISNYIKLSIIIAVRTMLFSLLLLIPGIVYSVNRVFSHYILITENTSIDEAMARSKELMSQQSWWALRGPLTRLSAIGVVIFMLSLMLNGLSSGLIFVQNRAMLPLVAIFVFKFIIALIQYFVICIQILCYAGLYHDLCIRYQGADIFHDLDSLASSKNGHATGATID